MGKFEPYLVFPRHPDLSHSALPERDLYRQGGTVVVDAVKGGQIFTLLCNNITLIF